MYCLFDTNIKFNILFVFIFYLKKVRKKVAYAAEWRNSEYVTLSCPTTLMHMRVYLIL